MSDRHSDGRLFFPAVTRILAIALTFVAVVTAAPAPAAAQGDPYAADPLRLVPFANTVQRVYSHGADTWEVWECHVPNWNTTVDLQLTVTTLNTVISGYFDWLSNGQYHPVFTVGGEVTSNDTVPADLGQGELEGNFPERE